MKLPQLTLRDLFWLVLVCALAVGWWRELRARANESSKVLNWQSRAAELQGIMESEGWEVRYSDDCNHFEVTMPKEGEVR